MAETACLKDVKAAAEIAIGSPFHQVNGLGRGTELRPERRGGIEHRLRHIQPPPQPRHNIPRHLIPIGLIQDLMPRRRVQLDRHIGHTGIPVPLPQLLQQAPAC